MANLFWFLIFLGLFLSIGFLLWGINNRKYESSSTVASAYDKWTKDQLLEILWGEHIHLGHYGYPPVSKDFRVAKVDFVHNLVRWSGLDQLPPGSRVLDVGCGIGGSARILARDYGFDVLGVTISSSQVKRAEKLTPSSLSCKFQLMDALDLKFEDGSFDGVWSVECGPHIPDKQRYADELQRVLRPGGFLVVADWNRRNVDMDDLTLFERFVMSHLLDQWAHPHFSSIPEFRGNLLKSKFSGAPVDTDDWTLSTLPSWLDSILEGFRRPLKILRLGPQSFLKGLREIPTILLMHWAFSSRLMQFGVFRSRG